MLAGTPPFCPTRRTTKRTKPSYPGAHPRIRTNGQNHIVCPSARERTNPNCPSKYGLDDLKNSRDMSILSHRARERTKPNCPSKYGPDDEKKTHEFMGHLLFVPPFGARKDKNILSVRSRKRTIPDCPQKYGPDRLHHPRKYPLCPPKLRHILRHVFSPISDKHGLSGGKHLDKHGQSGDFLVCDALYHPVQISEDNIILSPLTVPNCPFCTIKKLLQGRTTKRDCPKPKTFLGHALFVPKMVPQ
jgi:hypothetical protein